MFSDVLRVRVEESLLHIEYFPPPVLLTFELDQLVLKGCVFGLVPLLRTLSVLFEGPDLVLGFMGGV